MTSVSIALAAWNGEQYLEAQLRSIGCQTQLPDQLVIADDSSTDKTLDVVRRMKPMLAMDIKVIEGSMRVGYGGNFARALAHCDGEIILLADQDDFWLPSKVQRSVDFFNTNPRTDLMYHDAIVCDADLTPTDATMFKRLQRLGIPEENYVKGCCTAFRSGLGRFLQDAPAALPHDEILHRVANRLDRRATLAVPLILYRIHGANTSSFQANSVEKIRLKSAATRRALRLRRRLRRREFEAGWRSQVDKHIESVARDLGGEYRLQEIAWPV